MTGLRCLDVGASTGGFTDCLLQHGARAVVAVDVGHGQLHWRLRQDPRVTVYEGVNARDLSGVAGEMKKAFDLAVVDVSFISLRKVLPSVFDLLGSGGRVCALIKPQFEAGRAEVGKGGIVRDAGGARERGERAGRMGGRGGFPGEDGGDDPFAAAGARRKRGILMAAAKTMTVGVIVNGTKPGAREVLYQLTEFSPGAPEPEAGLRGTDGGAGAETRRFAYGAGETIGPAAGGGRGRFAH